MPRQQHRTKRKQTEKKPKAPPAAAEPEDEAPEVPEVPAARKRKFATDVDAAHSRTGGRAGGDC